MIFNERIMTQAQNHWMKLSDPPLDTCSYDLVSHILTFNERELLIIVQDNDGRLNQIWIYNICNNNYTELISENDINEIIEWHTASLNDNKSFLYLFGSSGRIIKLNLKKK
eukprot:269751_1